MTSDHLSAESILHEYYMKEGGARAAKSREHGEVAAERFLIVLSSRSRVDRLFAGSGTEVPNWPDPVDSRRNVQFDPR
jgi:hypothetical protein